MGGEAGLNALAEGEAEAVGREENEWPLVGGSEDQGIGAGMEGKLVDPGAQQRAAVTEAAKGRQERRVWQEAHAQMRGERRRVLRMRSPGRAKDDP
jgi:hypothetical protein